MKKFSPAGPILSIRICRDLITRCSLGYSSVNFQQQEDADCALDNMDFDDIKGKQLRIMWSRRDPSLRKSGVGNIFIKNLDKIHRQESTDDIFSAFGNIRWFAMKMAPGAMDLYILKHRKQLKELLKKMNEMLLNDHKVFVGRFKSWKEQEAELGARAKDFTNVYIKNFREDMDDKCLTELFGKFGPALSVKVMTD